jgi:mRNA deadenylase 3'-5' endonuclease subunit Ccr4
MGSLTRDCCSQRQSTLPSSLKVVNRTWTKVRVSSSQADQLDTAKGYGDSYLGDNSLSIKVMHWNILADKLAEAFDKVNKGYLKWEYRFEMIK